MINREDSNTKRKVKNKILLKLEQENYFLPHNAYDNDILSEYISKSEFEALITDADKVISLSWISKRKYDRLKIPILVYGLALLSAICFVVYLILMYFAPTSENGLSLYYIGLGFCIVGILIASGLSVYNFLKKVTIGKDLDVFVCEGLEKWCRETNKTINENIGFVYNKEDKTLECMVYSINDFHDNDQVFRNLKEYEVPLMNLINNPQEFKERAHNKAKTENNIKNNFLETKKNI